MACFLGYAETLNILLERGCDLETNNDREEGALHMACRGGQMECFDAVLAAGGKPDKVSMDDQTPLHVATRLGHVEMVEKLVKAGANIEATANSYSALAIAGAGGGGRPDLARGGGNDVNGADAAIKAAQQILEGVS